MLLKVLILAVVQGAAELLPVSSSAHVIVAEKLLGLDPTRPEMTLLLVMLHTGTMFAVIFYFWKSWKKSFFGSRKIFMDSAGSIIAATFFTGVVGLLLIEVIEKMILRVPHAQVEQIFGNMTVIGTGLAAAGLLITIAGWKDRRPSAGNAALNERPLGMKSASLIGAVQGLCLPFRGFSRSGATISTGLILGVEKLPAEEFSFALAVVLTPPAIARELWRLMEAHHLSLANLTGAAGMFYPSILGMGFSFISGLLALRWLSNWLSRGRWHFFGVYCLAASAAVFVLHARGF
ncbi:MAG: undecaprenyl-diphosphate phosphatase [Nitrospiraceae bacterium]|nr:undecaprenyl-diphosphate phosphatase [Nitrospiraceae bacterium]